MSIYYYVTRKADPLDNDGPMIEDDEWKKLVSEDADLRLDNSSNPFPNRKIIYAVWEKYPGGYPAWFGLAEGSIEVKGLDDAILGKLRKFANALQCRIVCEDGEEVT